MIRRLLMVTGGGGTFVEPEPSTDPFTISDPPEGGWSEIGAPRGAYSSGHTYIGYVRGESDPNDIEVIDWNHSTQTRSGPFTLHGALTDGISTTPDTHNAPAVLVAPSGTIITAYSGHRASVVRIRRSSNPNDISAFEAEQTTTLPSAEYTYPVLDYLSDGDRFYLYWRDGTELHGASSLDEWETLEGDAHIYTAPGHLYFAHWSNGVDRHDFVVTDTAPELSNGIDPDGNGLWHFYEVGGEWFQTDGTEIPLANIPFDYTDLTEVVAPGGDVFPYSLSYTADGRPVVGCATQTVDPAEVYVMEWDGSAWQRYDVATVDAPGANIVVDATNANRALIDYPDGAGDNILEEYTRTASGAAWTFARTIDNAGHQPNGMVNVKNAGPGLRIIWQHGTFVAGDDYTMGIKGIA